MIFLVLLQFEKRFWKKLPCIIHVLVVLLYQILFELRVLKGCQFCHHNILKYHFSLPWQTSCEDWGGPRYWRWQEHRLPRSSKCWGWLDVGPDRRGRWQRWSWASTSTGRWFPPLKTNPKCTAIPEAISKDQMMLKKWKLIKCPISVKI